MAEALDDTEYEKAIEALLRKEPELRTILAEYGHLSPQERFDALSLANEGAAVLQASRDATKM